MLPAASEVGIPTQSQPQREGVQRPRDISRGSCIPARAEWHSTRHDSSLESVNQHSNILEQTETKNPTLAKLEIRNQARLQPTDPEIWADKHNGYWNLRGTKSLAGPLAGRTNPKVYQIPSIRHYTKMYNALWHAKNIYRLRIKFAQRHGPLH